MKYKNKKYGWSVRFFVGIAAIGMSIYMSAPFEADANAKSATTFKTYVADPSLHVFKSKSNTPLGFTPAQIKEWYNIPTQSSGVVSSSTLGTIAIIGAFDHTTIESDLAVFDDTFALASCSVKNGCFEKVTLHPHTPTNTGWGLETSLDVEWSHALAPGAHILLVEAKSAKAPDLLEAIDYARARKDVVAISMSWGGHEFPDETKYDSHFISPSDHTIAFFASSGDTGAGVAWPSVSPNVISVGGTTLNRIAGSTSSTGSSGSMYSEVAWSGSGGGVSSFEPQPAYQKAYSIARAHGLRAVPDVSYNADPHTGYSVYHAASVTPTNTTHTKSTASQSALKNNWFVVGGTSAGAPQWAAIYALGHSATLENLYKDKASQSNHSYLRDIISGSNGDCPYYCDARKRYDYVTGLGSPLTVHF